MPASALALTPNQQVTIGLACNGVFATVSTPLTNCVGPGGAQGHGHIEAAHASAGGYGPFPSEENDDHNPDRVKPRNVLNLGIGTDNLLHREGKRRITASVEIANLTNSLRCTTFFRPSAERTSCNPARWLRKSA